MAESLAHNSHTQIFTGPDGRKLVRKTSKLALPLEQVKEVAEMMTLQRQRFGEFGVPISELVSLDTVADPDGNNQIEVIEVFAGADLGDIVDGVNYPMYLERVLMGVFKPLLTAENNLGDDGWLHVGIDGIPRNLVYDQRQGSFVYVDFFPPKVRFNGKHVQEVPETPSPEFFEIRMIAHNSIPGIIYNLYINLLRSFPDQLPVTVAKLEQFCHDISLPEGFEYIEESPMYRQDTPKQLRSFFAELPNWHGLNFFYLREAANWLCYYGQDFSQQKQEIFSLTKQGRTPGAADYGIISQEKFARTKQILLNGLDAYRD